MGGHFDISSRSGGNLKPVGVCMQNLLNAD
jgi:hypothetical protein